MLRLPWVIGTSLRALRMPESRLMEPRQSSQRVCLGKLESLLWALAVLPGQRDGWKWPHTNVGQKREHMPHPPTPEPTFPHSEEHRRAPQLTSFEEWRALAGAWPLKRLVALWNDLPGVPPVQKFTNREIALERIWRFL